MMISELYLHNIVSSLPITYVFYLVVILKNFFFAFGLCFSDGIVVIIKNLSNYLDKTSWLYKITRRPVVGSTCDLLSQIPSKLNAPGFPSGHMAITLYFYTILTYLKYVDFTNRNRLQNNHNNNVELFIKTHVVDLAIYILLIILTGIARIRKGCHTLLQVFVGSIVGVLSSLIFIYFYYKKQHFFTS